MKLTLQSLVCNHTNFLFTHFHIIMLHCRQVTINLLLIYTGIIIMAHIVVVKFLFFYNLKRYIRLMHFGVADCNQAALLRTGILVAVSGILLF